VVAVGAGRKPRGPTPDDVFAVTGLTRDDLTAIAEGLEEAPRDPFPLLLDERTGEELREYLKEYHIHYHLPQELFAKLKQLIDTLRRPWTRDEIKRARWKAVARGYDALGCFRPSGFNPRQWTAYKIAELILEGTRAAAGPDMMKTDYDKLQETLPKAERHPSTRRKRQPWHPSEALKAAIELIPAAGAIDNATISKEQVAALEALIAEVEGDNAGISQKRLRSVWESRPYSISQSAVSLMLLKRSRRNVLFATKARLFTAKIYDVSAAATAAAALSYAALALSVGHPAIINFRAKLP
jgi:hypothetical protein